MILLVYEITEFIISWVDTVLPSITIKITGSAIQDTSLEVRDHRIMNVTLNSTCVARKSTLACVYVLFTPKINMKICFCIFWSFKAMTVGPLKVGLSTT